MCAQLAELSSVLTVASICPQASRSCCEAEYMRVYGPNAALSGPRASGDIPPFLKKSAHCWESVSDVHLRAGRSYDGRTSGVMPCVVRTSVFIIAVIWSNQRWLTHERCARNYGCEEQLWLRLCLSTTTVWDGIAKRRYLGPSKLS